jgi:hypothetical protein
LNFIEFSPTTIYIINIKINATNTRIISCFQQIIAKFGQKLFGYLHRHAKNPKKNETKWKTKKYAINSMSEGEWKTWPRKVILKTLPCWTCSEESAISVLSLTMNLLKPVTGLNSKSPVG